MRIKRVAIIAIALLCVVVFVNQFREDLWDKNSGLLKKNVISLDETVETVRLTDVTPFEWDEAYSFDPYTTKDKMYDAIGYKWDSIKETVSEGMNQIVFLKDGKVVCYIYGYPDNNGYSIVFSGTDYKNIATMLTLDDNLSFEVTRRNGVVYLKNIK